jgi:hypothetical protein
MSARTTSFCSSRARTKRWATETAVRWEIWSALSHGPVVSY